jgi:hypothetical protein
VLVGVVATTFALAAPGVPALAATMDPASVPAALRRFPILPEHVKHTPHGDVWVYDRKAVTALPGVQVKMAGHVPATPPAARATPAPSATASPADETWAAYSGLGMVYIDGAFICGFGVGSMSAAPFAGVAEAGVLQLDGVPVDGTYSSGVDWTGDETGCDNFLTPPGTQWNFLVKGWAFFPDATRTAQANAVAYQ